MGQYVLTRFSWLLCVRRISIPVITPQSIRTPIPIVVRSSMLPILIVTPILVIVVSIAWCATYVALVCPISFWSVTPCVMELGCKPGIDTDKIELAILSVLCLDCETT